MENFLKKIETFKKYVNSLLEEADQKPTEWISKKKLHKGCNQLLDFVSKSH